MSDSSFAQEAFFVVKKMDEILTKNPTFEQNFLNFSCLAFTKIINRFLQEPISGSNGDTAQTPQFNGLENGTRDTELKQLTKQPHPDQNRPKVSPTSTKKCLCERVKTKKSTLATSAGIPNPILDPFAEDTDFPDSEIAWKNAKRIDNPYHGLFRQGTLVQHFF